MTDATQDAEARAREVLAVEYDRAGYRNIAAAFRAGNWTCFDHPASRAMLAFEAAALERAADHNIILISEDYGCQTHGLFSTFEDALAHAKKDGLHHLAQWEVSSPDRRVILDGKVFWTASREPIRALKEQPK